MQVLNEGLDFKPLNVTNIVLIPKILNPSNLKNFKPISLCNVLYKVITTMIVNWLKYVISKCINNSQSAFTLGRLIFDNVLVAYEILHTIWQKRMGKKGFMAVKSDMNQAYDRVEWQFIKEVMIQMGFIESWVSMVMKCVILCFIFSHH